MTNSKLKLLLVGANGTLGKAVHSELGARHTIITASRNSGDVHIDISDPASIAAGLAKVGPVDGVMCAAGNVAFAPLGEIQAADIASSVYGLGLRDKLLGQVNLALEARKYLREGGSITLISGITGDHPIVTGSSASMVCAALAGFVRAAAIEMPKGLRINLVSPTVFDESMDVYGAYFRGFPPVPVARAALGYSRSVEGAETGQVYRFFGLN